MLSTLKMIFGDKSVKWLNARQCEVEWGQDVYVLTRHIYDYVTVEVREEEYHYADIFVAAEDIKQGLSMVLWDDDNFEVVDLEDEVDNVVDELGVSFLDALEVDLDFK